MMLLLAKYLKQELKTWLIISLNQFTKMFADLFLKKTNFYSPFYFVLEYCAEGNS